MNLWWTSSGGWSTSVVGSVWRCSGENVPGAKQSVIISEECKSKPKFWMFELRHEIKFSVWKVASTWLEYASFTFGTNAVSKWIATNSTTNVCFLTHLCQEYFTTGVVPVHMHNWVTSLCFPVRNYLSYVHLLGLLSMQCILPTLVQIFRKHVIEFPGNSGANWVVFIIETVWGKLSIERCKIVKCKVFFLVNFF